MATMPQQPLAGAARHTPSTSAELNARVADALARSHELRARSRQLVARADHRNTTETTRSAFLAHRVLQYHLHLAISGDAPMTHIEHKVVSRVQHQRLRYPHVPRGR